MVIFDIFAGRIIYGKKQLFSKDAAAGCHP
jgi:hypothetical protein